MAIILLWIFVIVTFITNYEMDRVGEPVSLIQSYSPWIAIAVLAICGSIKSKKVEKA